jgi:hypothetical protein
LVCCQLEQACCFGEVLRHTLIIGVRCTEVAPACLWSALSLYHLTAST